jgi:hypothetical protein
VTVRKIVFSHTGGQIQNVTLLMVRLLWCGLRSRRVWFDEAYRRSSLFSSAKLDASQFSWQIMFFAEKSGRWYRGGMGAPI